MIKIKIFFEFPFEYNMFLDVFFMSVIFLGHLMVVQCALFNRCILSLICLPNPIRCLLTSSNLRDPYFLPCIVHKMCTNAILLPSRTRSAKCAQFKIWTQRQLKNFSDYLLVLLIFPIKNSQKFPKNRSDFALI